MQLKLNLIYLLTLTLASLSAASPAAETGAAAAAAGTDSGAQPPAPTSTGSSSSDSSSSSPYQQCAKNILDACLSQMKPQMDKCSQNDWSCLCTQSKNMLTCYNDCPSDPNHTSADQQKMEYCNAAEANSLYSTSTSVRSSKTVVSSTSSQTSSRTAVPASTSSGAAGSVRVGEGVAGVGMMGLAGLVVALV
ncbi:hypothetical protein ASPFODRAFT_58881 [Aspergillus luchuensis CBS 106.47]|uniref:Extracellular membrane protein CFEM domain-containing protein n=1 Tax=Aspergillus luchuensis (strain CBS 106.47) TaxID=1137211 RepID=A0A1M3TMU9_ASPLC|nr:hypothetical protein ASPFODRAFT_58881 [Aspergillus luchuensis CBS 106.47]